MADPPDFTIIMPVCHGGRFLREALDSLRALEYAPTAFEVVIGGCTSAACVIGGPPRQASRAGDEEARRLTMELKEGAPFRVAYAPCDSATTQAAEVQPPTRSAQLNAAIALAGGRVLAFIDDDCVAPPGWLRDWRTVLDARPGIGAAGGSDELAPGGSAFDLALDWLLNSFIGSGGIRNSAHGIGRYYPRLWNMVIPRAVALNAALPGKADRPQVFNESFDVNEDVELAERIARTGKEVAYAPQVRVRHHRDTTPLSCLRRNFGMAQACRRAGLHRFPHTLLASGALGLLALTALSAWPGPWRMALAACAGAYAMVLLGSALAALASRRRLEMLFWVPLLLAGIQAARAAGYLLPSVGTHHRERYAPQ